jgi:hypothetical protein
VGGSPVGGRARVDVPAGYWLRTHDQRPKHPTNGAGGRVADSDKRGVDCLERAAQTFETASGRRPAQGTIPNGTRSSAGSAVRPRSRSLIVSCVAHTSFLDLPNR